MSRSLGNIIGDTLKQSLSYAERLQDGITGENYARLACPGGQVIQSNHPAFIYGHLALYPPRIVSQLGIDASPIEPSAGFQAVFSMDAQCVDDPDASIYPSKDVILQAFSLGYETALSALREVSDDVLQQPNPVEAMSPRFPTLGSMHTFYVGGHMMVHLGQLSAWRRMQGLRAA